MRIKTLILALFLVLIGCKKEITEPVNEKYTFTVSVQGRGYIHEFTLNGKTVVSPVSVHTGDKLYVYIVTYDSKAVCNYQISLDGNILTQMQNSRGIKFNYMVK